MQRAILLYFLLVHLSLAGQKHDYLWHLGQESLENPRHAGIILDFLTDSLLIFSEFRPTPFQETNSSAIDSFGNVLFYTNGIYVANGQGEIMENGHDLNPGYYANRDQEYGYFLIQGALILEYPSADNMFILFHLDHESPTEGQWGIWSQHFYLTEINMAANQGLGEVISKNQVIRDEKLAWGKLTATRHANGRDWWLIVRKYGSNEYYTYLSGVQGVHEVHAQTIGEVVPSPGIGQAVFTPDGRKYVHVNAVGYQGDPIYVNIYDFDRCAGMLSNPIQFTYADSSVCLGAAISPNSRFLYLSSYHHVYQYDLEAEDIEASRITVAEYDGFRDGGRFATTFYLAQLAPDGRIYISSNSSTRYLHVIEQPDSLGLACSVCQHCVELPSYNSFSIPNFPNYRLHHEEGSPCDTLRSPPLADWTYQDSALQVRFQDRSTHDIRRWQWSFGDGSMDTVAAPVHTYAQPGVYEVCLTVENPRGQDSYCENLAVFATSTTELAEEALLRVLPNPARRGEPLRLRLAAGLRASSVELVSSSGQQLGQWSVAAGQRELSLPTGSLAAGVYSLGLRLAEEVRWVKVVVQ